MNWLDLLFTRAPLQNMLLVSAMIFCCGLYVTLVRKNAIAVLMGLELLLNAVCINFVAFARYSHANIDGAMFVLFVILIAASEAAVALAIVICIYQSFRRADIDETVEMKG